MIRYNSVAYADIEGDLAVTQCYQNSMEFPRVHRRVVEARFDGGEITSDGGALLLRQADRYLGLTQAVAEALSDPRRRKSCAHDVRSLVRQRVYAVALGYEDLNDHDTLRREVGLQTVVERDRPLASASTLCRFEKRADRAAAWRLHQVLLEQFIAGLEVVAKELILDFDATDDPVHGEQAGRFFHGYYRRYCFLPLYVFCGDQLLVSYLRPSNIDAAKHSWAVLSLLVRRLRQAWPAVRIIFRGDSGFCRWKLLRWCERHGVDYIVGLAKNERLNALTAAHRREAAAEVAETGEKVRRFTELVYGARPWDRPRRVIAKIEHSRRGANPRYIVTSLAGDSAGTVRTAVLCPRRHGKPHQGKPTGSVCRPHLLSRVVAQPVPAAVGFTGLHADRDDPAHRLERHRAGARLCGYDPPEAVQDRCGDPEQYPPRAVPARQYLPQPGSVLLGGASPGRRISPARLLPDGVAGTRDARLCPKHRKTTQTRRVSPRSAPNKRPRPPPPNPELNPTRKSPKLQAKSVTGAISGLAVNSVKVVHTGHSRDGWQIA